MTDGAEGSRAGGTKMRNRVQRCWTAVGREGGAEVEVSQLGKWCGAEVEEEGPGREELDRRAELDGG